MLESHEEEEKGPDTRELPEKPQGRLISFTLFHPLSPFHSLSLTLSHPFIHSLSLSLHSLALTLGVGGGKRTRHERVAGEAQGAVPVSTITVLRLILTPKTRQQSCIFPENEGGKGC